MTTQKFIDENKTSTFKKGDKVIMKGCYEATLDEYKDKVWTCYTDSYICKSKEENVFLEGFSGCFSVEFLERLIKRL